MATNKNQITVEQNQETEPAATCAKHTVGHILSHFPEFSVVKAIFKSHCLSAARTLLLMKHTMYLQVFFLTFKDEDITGVLY